MGKGENPLTQRYHLFRRGPWNIFQYGREKILFPSGTISFGVDHGIYFGMEGRKSSFPSVPSLSAWTMEYISVWKGENPLSQRYHLFRRGPWNIFRYGREKILCSSGTISFGMDHGIYFGMEGRKSSAPAVPSHSAWTMEYISVWKEVLSRLMYVRMNVGENEYVCLSGCEV